MLAQILVWLLLTYADTGGTAVIAAPTLRPQGAISRDRLMGRMRQILPDEVRMREGHIVELGNASARFLSALPTANVRGQTADLLLVANEAQAILPSVWDPVFDPMAVSTNATTLFMGTPWKRDSLLSRQNAPPCAGRDRDGRSTRLEGAMDGRGGGAAALPGAS